jgi:protein SCO1
MSRRGCPANFGYGLFIEMNLFHHMLSVLTMSALLLATTASGIAQVPGKELPDVAQGIGVDSKLGTVIDGSIKFTDTDNNVVELGTLFDGSKSTILSFNYSDCPKLCSAQLDMLTRALREISFSVGQEFQIISVSIDPNEQSSRARETREKFREIYDRKSGFDRPDSAGGWHFLTGEESQIRKLADQCGVRYKYIPEQKLFSHPPILILVSPEGKIVRYLYGLDVQAATMKQALIETSEGKIGSPIEFLSYFAGCYRYDEMSGKYTVASISLMRIGGLITILVLFAGLAPYLFFKRRPASSAGKSEPAKISSQARVAGN